MRLLRQVFPKDELLKILADAYYDAACRNASMRKVTETLETIRSELLFSRNPFRMWEMLDDKVGKADEYFLETLVTTRKKIIDLYTYSEISRIHEDVAEDPDVGWTNWLSIYLQALCDWRISFCEKITEESYAFNDDKMHDFENFRKFTKFLLHDQWLEAYEYFIKYSEHPDVSSDYRADLMLTAALIQLFHYDNFQKTSELIDLAEEISPDNIRVKTCRGQYLLKMGETENAKILFQEVIDAEPNSRKGVNGYTGLGEAFESVQDYEEAEWWYTRATRNTSAPEEGYSKLISLYGTPSLFDTRKESIDQFVKRRKTISPEEEYSTYIKAGYQFQRNGEYGGAHDYYNRAIELDSSHLDAYFNHGRSYIEEIEYEKAINEFSKALDISPTDYYALIWQGVAYQNLDQHEKALQNFSEALKYWPDMEKKITSTIDHSEFKLGNYTKILDRYIESLRGDPTNKDMLTKIERRIIEFYKTSKEITVPLQYYKDVRDIIGDSYEAEYQNALGDLYYHLERYTEALPCFEEAAQNNPTNPLYYSNIAYTWDKLENSKNLLEALEHQIQYLRKASELSPEYYERLGRLLKRKESVEYFGQWIETKPPTIVTPIRLEMSLDLAYYVSNDDVDLIEDTKKLGDQLRERILTEFGVKIPGISYRASEDLSPGSYNIQLFETKIAENNISLDLRLYDGKRSELSYWIRKEYSTNSITGDEEIWISKNDWEKVDGEKLWTVIEYPIRHLEAVIRNNLGLFVGYQEVSDRLREEDSNESWAILNETENVVDVLWIIKSLLKENISIINLKVIIEEYLSQKDDSNLDVIVSNIRGRQEIRKTLPGNEEYYYKLELDPYIENKLNDLLNQDNVKYLELESKDIQKIHTFITDNAFFPQKTALIINSPTLRPHVKQVIESVFPRMPVLSKQEVLSPPEAPESRSFTSRISSIFRRQSEGEEENEQE